MLKMKLRLGESLALLHGAAFFVFIFKTPQNFEPLRSLKYHMTFCAVSRSTFLHFIIVTVVRDVFIKAAVCKFKIVALKNLAVFTGNSLCWSPFFNKVVVLRSATLLKRKTNTGVFL